MTEISVDEAIRRYGGGDASAWACARAAGLPLAAFLGELKLRGVPFRTDEGLLREQVETLIRDKGSTERAA